MQQSRNMQNPRQKMDFWSARIMQAALIFVTALLFLPVFWSFFFLLFSGWLQELAMPISKALFLTFKVYPRSFITAILIALVLAFRSATWGTVTFRFSMTTIMLMVFMIDGVLRVSSFLWHDQLEISGFGNEPFLYLLLSWFISGLLLWLALHVMGLDQRYSASERLRLNDACKAVVVYALFGPILYVVFLLVFVVGDQLPMLAARGPITGQLTPAALIMSAFIIMVIVRQLRRKGSVSWSWLFSRTVAIMALFCALDAFAMPKENLENFWFQYVLAYFFSALILTAVAGLTIKLMGVPFSGHPFSSMLAPKFGVKYANTKTFAITVCIILLVVAPPLWQLTSILWRSLLFGLPPVSHFHANISLAYIHGGLLLALPIGLWAWAKKQLTFTAMFFITVFFSIVGSFTASSYLGVSFGFFYDHLGWAMLVFVPTLWSGWFILSRIRNIKNS